MIIFYQKSDGKIIGTIEGYIHNEDQLKMWIGNKNETDRLIVTWKPYQWIDKEGNIIPKDCLDVCDENGNLLVIGARFKPDHKQKDLMVTLIKKPSEIFKYKVNSLTKKLINLD